MQFINMIRKTILFIVFYIFFAAVIKAQDPIDLSDDYVVYGVIIDGDTILISNIEEVIIFPKPKFKTRREWRKYYRLIRHVKKVYPLVKTAGETYDSIAANLLSMPTKKEQKIYVKQMEKEITAKYEGAIRKLTITQGKILLKLIDREIGETSYDLLKELKGSFTAFFWQTIARIFGQNLKIEFDAEGKDKLLDEIMILIENGQL